MNPSTKDISAEQAGILTELKGVVIAVDGVAGTVTVRPLTMGDLLNPSVIEDVARIGRTLFESIEHLQRALKAIDGATGTAGLDEFENVLMDVLKPCLPATRRVLGLCLDQELHAIPLPLVPGIMKAFVQQNFSGPRLKPWVALLGGMRTRENATAPKSPSTSETLSSS